MRAIDVFGLAAAVVIALLVQIIQPRSRPWWAGMILAGAIALAAVGNIIRNNRSEAHVPSVPPARLSVIQIEFFPPAKNTKPKMRYTLANVGGASAAYILKNVSYEVSPDLLTADDEDELAGMMPAVPLQGDEGGNEFQPGEGGQYWHNLDGVSSEAYRDIRAGKQFLYVMFKVSYQDDATPSGKRRLTEVCRFYSSALNEQKWCAGHNRTYLID
jgi:hypothetical protein